MTEQVYNRFQWRDFSVLHGLTIAKIEGLEIDSEEVAFTTTTGRVFFLSHHQSCCESVRVADVAGDADDLIGEPLLMAEEVSNADGPAPEYADSYTWTFYKLATRKGYVDIRWLGESNGWYGESVDFKEDTQPQ